MNWFEKLEHRKRFIVVALTLIAVTTVTVTAMRTMVAYDTWWHLQMGKDWIENGLSPWVDHYSYTFNGSEIQNPPFIFQALLYKLVDFFGEFGGFLAIKLSAFLLTFSLMLTWLNRLKAPALAYCLIIPMLAFLLELRSTVRPELLSYPLIIVAMLLYERARGQISFKTMWPIILLVLFWTNYHSSIFAYVIFFGLFLDAGVRMLQSRSTPREWVGWATWGFLLVAIGFVNLQGSHAVLDTLLFPSEWKQHIQEFGSPVLYKALPAAYALVVVAILTSLTLIRQRKFGYLVITLVVCYSGMTMSRLVTPGGVILLCIFSHAISDAMLGIRLQTMSTSSSKSIALISLVLFLTPLTNSVLLARELIDENRRSILLYPYNMIEHIENGEKMDRVLNSYELGGFLVHRFPFETKVYIDGRTGILYPLEHYERSLQVGTFVADLKSDVALYDIDAVILRADSRVAALMNEAGFMLDYPDNIYALYRRNAGKFKQAGILWAHPSCWDNNIADTLKSEWLDGWLDLPPASPILPLAMTALNFDSFDDPDEFFDGMEPNSKSTDATQRFLGYRAIEAHRFDLALDQFGDIAQKTITDYLATTLVYLKMGRLNDAESELEYISSNHWELANANDLRILRELLLSLSQLQNDDLINSGSTKHAKRSTAIHGLYPRNLAVNVQSFCRRNMSE